MHLIIIVVHNRYDSTAYFVDGWERALRRAGCSVTRYEAEPHGQEDLLHLIEREQPDRTFSFSDIRIGGQSPSLYTGIPHFSYFLDPAPYFLPHLRSECSCCDESEVARLHDLGYPHPFFLPVGIEPSEPLPSHVKSWDCVYFGSCLDVDPQEQQWSDRYGSRVATLMRTIAEEVLTGPTLLWDALQHAPVPPTQFLTLFHEIEHWVRGIDRIRMLRAVPPERLTIWGDGPWTSYLPQVQCLPPVSFHHMRTLLTQSRFVLNSAIRFKHGLHERCLYAWDAGAIPITLTTPPWSKDFGTQGSYPPGKWDQIPDLLEYGYADYDAHVAQGRQQCHHLHSWDVRVQQWLSHVLNPSTCVCCSVEQIPLS